MVSFNKRKYLFRILFFLAAIYTPIVSSQPVIQQVSCYPSEPMPQSNVTFVVGVNSSNFSIDQVCLIVQECRGDLCSIYSQNLSMNYSYSCCMDFYETEFKGKREDATQIKYHVEILSNGSWYFFETAFIDLLENPNNNKNDSNKNTIPGFEIVLILISMIFIIYLKKR